MKKKLQIIADRALKEAQDRKKKRQKHKKKTELNGPSGPEPVSYTHLTLPTNREV